MSIVFCFFFQRVCKNVLNLHLNTTRSCSLNQTPSCFVSHLWVAKELPRVGLSRTVGYGAVPWASSTSADRRGDALRLRFRQPPDHRQTVTGRPAFGCVIRRWRWAGQKALGAWAVDDGPLGRPCWKDGQNEGGIEGSRSSWDSNTNQRWSLPGQRNGSPKRPCSRGGTKDFCSARTVGGAPSEGVSIGRWATTSFWINCCRTFWRSIASARIRRTGPQQISMGWWRCCAAAATIQDKLVLVVDPCTE